MATNLDIADYTPHYIKKAFSKIDLNSEQDFWNPYELKALSKLFNLPEMIEVYDSISRYQPDEHMWQEIIIHGFAEPYAYIITGRDKTDAIFNSLADSFFSDVI